MPKPPTSSEPESSAPSFDTIPALAADPDFINGGLELIELKTRMKRDEDRYNQLRIELGGRARPWASSVRFLDIVLVNAKGSKTPGAVELPTLILGLLGFGWPDAKVQAAIALAATAVDEAKLLSVGVPAHIIQSSRGPDRTTQATVRVEMAGGRSKKK